MKKILVLLLAMLLVLPVLPVYAANDITVYVQNYNSVSRELEVYVKSANENFAGAEITLDNEEIDGIEISYDLVASGKGSHLALIDVSSLTKDGEYTLTVSSDCGEGSPEIDTKTINLAKTLVEKTEFDYDNLDIVLNINSDTSSYNQLSDGTLKINFTSATNKDYRLGWGGDGTGGTVSTENKNINPSGGNITFEFEIKFQNGSDTETQEKPQAYTFMAFRQDRNKSVASGYPTNTAGAAPASIANSFSLFNSTGKIDGSGVEYKTNIWYKGRIVFDMVTKDDDGNLIGGVTFLLAEEGENGYGDFVVQKQQANYLLNNLRHFRFEPKSNSTDCSIYFKNISITREEPLGSWYFENADYADGKINAEFSEDMGELKAEDIMLLNTVKGDEIAITAITKTGDATYEITTERAALNYGREYEIYAKNALASASNAYAFLEPDTDENEDGFWKMASFIADKYELNIASVVKSSSAVNVTFNNTDVEGMLASVCWYDANGYMVDCVIAPVTAANGETQTFTRATDSTASKVKVIVFELSEGADKVYEVYED